MKSEMSLPQQLYSAEQVRALDRCAIDEFKISGITLMERAGTATFVTMRQQWPARSRIAVFCGGGNNGGDGFVVARLAKEEGLDVVVYLLAEASRLKGDAKLAYQQMISASVTVKTGSDSFDENVDILVDALLGTGLSGDVEGQWKTTIEWMNQQKENTGCKIVAADIPSGLNADTGSILGVAIKADLTVTFIGVKQGLLTAKGPEYCGKLVYNDLQVDAQVYDRVPSASTRLDPGLVRTFFPKRLSGSHKGTHGHVLVIGGNYGMAGAVRLAGEAALRCGAGMVSVACRPEHVSTVVSHRPEIMCHGLGPDLRTLVTKLKSLLNSVDCIVVGPGLGQDEWAQQILSVVRESRLPTVMDADALNLTAQDNDNVRRDLCVFTPHPGEAGRMLGLTTQQVQNDRFTAVEQLQSRFGGTVILKGNGTLVRDSKGATHVCTAGNPGMGTAGMGDVLSGIIAACITQSRQSLPRQLLQSGQLDEAAQVAVLLHATAGDLAAEAAGERGLIASDLFPFVRQLVNP